MLLFETIGVIALGVACLLAARRFMPAARKAPRTPGRFA